jgi:hypothetical protein
MPAKYVRPYSKGQKNDFRDAEAIAEAVQRPTMKLVATKTADQLDLQALHRVRGRLVGQRTGIINQIAPSCWSAASRCGKGCTFCGPSCPASWRSALTFSRRAWAVLHKGRAFEYVKTNARRPALSSRRAQARQGVAWKHWRKPQRCRDGQP